MFFSLFFIFFLGGIGGIVFAKLRLPKLIWYIVLGLLIGPSVFDIVDDSLLQISSYLRQVALIIILTQSGLSLDIKTLREIGRPAILMCFIPACFEIFGVFLFGPWLLGIHPIEALLLGSVLAAVSPAVVVPRMLKLKEEGYGTKHHVPELIMAGSSCDDIFVIVLFYSFKNLAVSNTFHITSLVEIPISIILGIALGVAMGFLFSFIIKRVKVSVSVQTILLLGLSFGMIGLENLLKPYVSISALLAIIVCSILTSKLHKANAMEIKQKYNGLWQGFEILLFTLVGCATNAKLAFSKEGIAILLLIFLLL